MKKILSVLMILMLTVSAVAFAESADVTGDWYATYEGILSTLTVKEDGTAHVAYGEQSADGVWVIEDGNLVLNKDSIGETVLTIAGDMLLALNEGMAFTREPEPTVEAADVIGDWYAVYNGTLCTLTVNEDGTAHSEYGSSIVDNTWVIEGGNFIFGKGEDSETVMTVGNGAMVITSSGVIFTHEPLAVAVESEDASDVDITAFNGTWALSSLECMGQTLEGEDAQLAMGDTYGAAGNTDIIVENGKVSMFGEDAIPFVFANNSLCLYNEPTDEAPVMTLAIGADGNLICDMMGFVTCYYVPAN